MKKRVLISGAWGRVVWAVDSSGRSPGRDFYERLEKAEKAKLYSPMKELAEKGRVPSRERFKKLGNLQGQALWEIKSFQLRLIGTYSPRREFVVAHGLKKKQHELRPSDMKIAARVLNNHFEEDNNGEEAEG